MELRPNPRIRYTHSHTHTQQHHLISSASLVRSQWNQQSTVLRPSLGTLALGSDTHTIHWGTRRKRGRPGAGLWLQLRKTAREAVVSSCSQSSRAPVLLLSSPVVHVQSRVLSRCTRTRLSVCPAPPTWRYPFIGQFADWGLASATKAGDKPVSSARCQDQRR